jgi:hypothetical protein
MMKKLFLIAALLMGLAACGDEGGGSAGGSSSAETGSHSDLAAAGAGASPAAGITVDRNPADMSPPSVKAYVPTESERFDENGHIRGMYGVPYIPKKPGPP